MNKFKIQRLGEDGFVVVEEDHARAAMEKLLRVTGEDRKIVQDFANPDTKVRYMTVGNGYTFTVTRY